MVSFCVQSWVDVMKLFTTKKMTNTFLHSNSSAPSVLLHFCGICMWMSVCVYGGWMCVTVYYIAWFCCCTWHVHYLSKLLWRWHLQIKKIVPAFKNQNIPLEKYISWWKLLIIIMNNPIKFLCLWPRWTCIYKQTCYCQWLIVGWV